MIRLTLVVALLLFETSTSYAALSPPKLDVGATCRRAYASIGGQESTYENCLRTEVAAQQELAKKWSTFKAASITTCLAGVKIGGAPSYVELVTCLELAKQAAESAAENRKPLQLPKPRPSPGGKITRS
jgi:hypothetical protein